MGLPLSGNRALILAAAFLVGAGQAQAQGPSPVPGPRAALGGCDAVGEPAPQEGYGRGPVPSAPRVNVDFASRALFGYGSLGSWGFPVAYDAVLKRAYVGFRSTLAVLSVADKRRPALLGWLDMDGAQVTSILVPVSGTPTLLVSTTSQVGRIDASVPSSPSWLGSPVALGSPRGLALGVSSLLVASGQNLVLLDAATLATQSVTPLGANAYGVAASGNVAYVATEAGLHLFDITVPSAPVSLSFSSSASARAVAVQDRSGTLYAFVANKGGSPDLTVFDVTVPSNPVQLATLDPSSGEGTGLSLNGNTLYLAGTTGGLQVVDVTTPSAPALVTAYAASDAYGVVSAGTDLYVHARKGGLVLLDASTAPSPPVSYGDFPAPGAWGLDIRGGYGYFAGATGLFVVDLTSLSFPRVVGRATGMAALDVKVSGTTAFVADNGGYLHVVDVSVPTAPVLSTSFALPGAPVALQVRGGYAYVASDSAGLVVVRLSDGAQFALPTTYWAWDVALSGNLAYVATYWSDYVNPSSGQVEVVDVSNPEAPVLLGSAVTQNGVSGVAALGSYLYAATDWGLEVFNVATPAAPYFVGGFQADLSTRVSVADGLAYLARGTGEVSVLDVSSPWAPAQVASMPAEPWPVKPLYRDGYCYVASAIAGVYVFHATGACYDRYEPNDDFDHAWPLEAGAYYDALVCNGADADHYALTLPSGGTLSAALTPPAGLNYDLFLYDPARSLVGSSTLGAGAVESLSYTATSGGGYTLLVNGSDSTQYSGSQTYRLTFSFTPCPAPTQPLLIYSARLDPNGDVILDILDPNQPSTRTGYNVYRAGSPTGPWALRAGNVVDMDQGTANAQYVDAGSNAGGPYYYLVTALNAACGAEGP